MSKRVQVFTEATALVVSDEALSFPRKDQIIRFFFCIVFVLVGFGFA